MWGCAWGERFGPAAACERRVFTPPEPGSAERQRLELLVDEALAVLARGNRRLVRRLNIPKRDGH